MQSQKGLGALFVKITASANYSEFTLFTFLWVSKSRKPNTVRKVQFLKFLDLKSETRARIFDIISSSGQSGLFWNPYLKCQTSVQFLFLCASQSVLSVSVFPSQYWLFQTPRNARWQLLTAEEIKLLWCVRFQSLLYFYFDRFFLKLSSTCCGGELYLYLYL